MYLRKKFITKIHEITRSETILVNLKTEELALQLK